MSHRIVNEITVENLQVEDIATFRQSGKVALYKKHLHEKVTAVDEQEDGAFLVSTVNKKGIEDQYLIPAGTVMRTHVTVENDDLNAE